jgi:phasin family protein
MNAARNDPNNPLARLQQMLERVRMPSLDVASLIEARRRDINAVIRANQVVFAGAEALTDKQVEILRATLAGARSAATEVQFSGTPAEIAAKQRTLIAKAFQMALAHMRDLAEIVRNAQADAFGVIKGQVEQDLRALAASAVRIGGKSAAPVPASKPARKPRKRSGVTKATPTAKRATRTVAKAGAHK